MRHLFGEEVEIVPSAPGLEPRHELMSQRAKNNADHLFGKYYVVVPVRSIPIDCDTLEKCSVDEVETKGKTGRKTRSDSEILTSSLDQKGNLFIGPYACSAERSESPRG